MLTAEGRAPFALARRVKAPDGGPFNGEIAENRKQKVPTPALSSVQRACIFAPTELDRFMFQYVALAKDKKWQPGPYEGVELMVLHQHPTTGGVTVLRKFRAGTTVPAHTHPQASEFVFILSGDWEEAGVTYTTGAYFHAPRGQQHGPHVARTEVVSLTMFDGPLTVV